MKTAELLKLRRKMHAKRPAFKHQDSYKHGEVSSPWRRPRGMHSKMRRCVRGKPAVVSEGYRGPKAVRGLHNSGLLPVLAHNTKELEGLNPKVHGIILASIGTKKKQTVLQSCKEKGLTVLNIKNIDTALSKIAEGLEKRKQAKSTIAKKKAEKVVKKPEEKPLAEKVETEKEKRERERKEMEKVLTKRE
jgi:large subunit ribosomal protein L32e